MTPPAFLTPLLPKRTTAPAPRNPARELAMIGVAKRRSVEEIQRMNIRRVTREMRERLGLPYTPYLEDR